MARHTSKKPASASRTATSTKNIGRVAVSGDEYRDGYTRKNSYLVIAKTADNARALAVRHVGSDIRVHAYPNFRAFGITPTTNSWHREALGYMSTWIPAKDLGAFLAQMTKLRGMNLMDLGDIQTKLKVVLVNNDAPTGFTPLPDSELDHPNDAPYGGNNPEEPPHAGWGEDDNIP